MRLFFPIFFLFLASLALAQPGFKESWKSTLSGDGRFIAFESKASNLVEGDANGTWDIFVRDTRTKATARVSVSSSGGEGNGVSWAPSVSADGRFVAFYSSANNLVPGDTNHAQDIFVHDRETGETFLVSQSMDGGSANRASDEAAISADGRTVVFTSLADNLVPGDTNEVEDVFLFSLDEKKMRRVSVSSKWRQGNEASWAPAVSGDGRYVVFESKASNLIKEDKNGRGDIFLHDLQTKKTRRIAADSFAPSISHDGNLVVFESAAGNLTPEGSKGRRQVYLYDRTARDIRLVSRGSGTKISGDGHYIVFHSPADNGEKLSVYETATGKTAPVAEDFDPDAYAAISGDGAQITFTVSGTADIFVVNNPLLPSLQ